MHTAERGSGCDKSMPTKTNQNGIRILLLAFVSLERYTNTKRFLY